MFEEFFPARDGLRLFERRWQPQGGTGTPGSRAEVLLVYGFVEHGGRYAPTAEALAGRGFGVSATDLRGHGRSDGSRCWIRPFDEYLDDLDAVFDRVVGRAAGKPVFLLGHSLGGLIAVLWCIRRQPKLAGLILSGPAVQVRQQLFPWLRRLAGLGSVFSRNCAWSAWVAAAFREIRPSSRSSTPTRWSFTAVFPFARAEILRAGDLARAELEKLRVPLLILHGTADRVAAVETSQELLQRAEATDKTLRLYPGLYHEVLNEPERAKSWPI